MPFQIGNYKGRAVHPEVSLRSRYLWFFKFAYGRRAKRKNIKITITEDEFISLVTSNCHYCDRPHTEDTRLVNGSLINMLTVDRKDSDKGYIPDNCVPCCKRCNTIKMDMSYEEFKRHLVVIVKHMRLL